MGRRTLLLLAALVVAALGTTGVFLYVNGIDERATADFQVDEILVATAPIAAGTTAQAAQDAGALDLRPFLRKSYEGLPALSDITGIADKAAIAPIAAGEPILEGQFGDQRQTTRLPIPDGKLAVSVQLDDPARVADFVEPSDEVTVFLTTAAGADASRDVTRVLLKSVQVLAKGSTTIVPTDSSTDQEEADQAEVPKALLTLALDQVEAQKVVYGSQHGQLYFGLLTPESDVSPSDTGITAENLFD